MARDVVCGMQVDRQNPVARTEYKGKEYVFCSELCRIRFEEDPERYLRSGSSEEHSEA